MTERENSRPEGRNPGAAWWKRYGSDVLLAAGMTAVTAGVGMLSLAAGMICGGLLLICGGVLLALGGGDGA